MKLSIVNLAFIFVIFAANYVDLSIQDEECNAFMKKMMLDQMKFVVPCISKLGLKTPEDKKTNVFCIMRCVLQDAHMLAADGNVDFDLVNKILDDIPPALKDRANTIFTECGQFAAELDPSEKTCQSYGPLLTCLTDIASKIC